MLGNPQGVELIPKLPGFSADKDQTGGPRDQRGPARHPGGVGAGALDRLRRGRGDRARHQRPRADDEAQHLGGPGAARVGPAGRAPGRVGRVRLAAAPRQLPAGSGRPDAAGVADGPGADQRPGGARIVRRRDQADHAPRRGAGAGHEARRGRSARGQGPDRRQRHDPAGRPRPVRVRPGDGRRARRRPEPVRHLGGSPTVLGQGARPSPPGR